METASLRIKFTPLLNNAFKNNSECCLEIVPEVSCVQNLDKISWKQERDLIEYTIPMTYKIILKKREIPKEIETTHVVCEKTYHSCVDLLPSSSMTGIDFASGDVTRMISDTYILNNLKAEEDIEKPIVNINIDVNNKKTHITKNRYNANLQEVLFHGQERNIIGDREDNVTSLNSNAFSKSFELEDPCEAVKYPLEKFTTTESFYRVYKETRTQYVETTTEISMSCDGSKRKLSISPICSINTNDNPFPETVKEMNLAVDPVCRYSVKTQNTVAQELPVKNEAYENAIKSDYHNLDLDKILDKALKRELPAVRVAKFVKKMEREIMPLQIMLNEILHKCSTLGLSKHNHTAHNLVLYRSVPSSLNQLTKYCKSEGKARSNRVVYSVVFDG